jgi:hypothetical protein
LVNSQETSFSKGIVKPVIGFWYKGAFFVYLFHIKSYWITGENIVLFECRIQTKVRRRLD